MKLDKIKYTFKNPQRGPVIFRGISGEQFEITMKYIDDLVLKPRSGRIHDLVVIASVRTRLGVIDCFVN